MQIDVICPASWGANCYLIFSGDDAYVVDPSPSADAIVARANRLGVGIQGILLTHGHFDHVISAESLHNATGAPVFIHSADADALGDPVRNAYLSFFGQERVFRAADAILSDGDMLYLNGEALRVIHTPGHTPGSVCFAADDFIVTGDTLFADGFGRCDLPGGSLHAMKSSLKLLHGLDHSLPIYPGHGASSTLGDATGKIMFLR